MKLKHNKKLSIASALSATSRKWKNKKWTWQEFATKLSQPHYTSETEEEYLKATKPEQGKIKDVGGYVAAYLNGGRRKPDSVIHRQILTLDLDFAHLDFWDDFLMVYDVAAILHTTHSHTEAAPRYRLIVPLSRECTPDEYTAVARHFAGVLGIDKFDRTTFQTSRLMFWPSSPKGSTYGFKIQDSPFLNVDKTLAKYEDWTDASLWPTSSQHTEHINGEIKKQQDPTLKKGIVGMFCKAYSISECIDTFLKEEYLATDTPDRYTYTKGSTSCGLVVYDDKFAYSHHGTDPVSGQLCNAFDLVRVHLYGHLDTGQVSNPSSKKSYKAMQTLCTEDAKVKSIMAYESIVEAKYDFAEGYEEPESDDDEQTEDPLKWAEALEVDTRGKYLGSANNLNLILSSDSRLVGAFKYNSFDNKRYLFKSVPWRTVREEEPFRNVDYSGLRNYIDCVYGIAGNLKIDDALALEFERNSFHPVRDYLKEQVWDKTERVDTILIDYFGVEDTLYHREAIRKTLAAGVARIFNAGAKFDLVLTLIGDQGTGKSTLVDKLGGRWFYDSFTTVKGKEAFEQLQGAWLIEIPELSALRKADVEPVKHFISKREDTFRPAFARAAETFKRQCVFIATTNEEQFLTDQTGNRRFIPVTIQPKKATKNVFKLSVGEVGQIWAEAVQMYRKGETLYMSKEANTEAAKHQDDHKQVDERQGIISDYLELKLPKNWAELDLFSRKIFLEEGKPEKNGTTKKVVCVAEVWCECLGKDKTDMNRYKTKDINDMLKNLKNWERINSTKNFKLYGKQKYYKRIR